MPFSRIHSKFKKGTVYFVTDAVKPLHLLGNIYFNGFDIYGMLQICVNILPPFSKHNRRRNGDKIENTHSIINFSELISKVCINYVSLVHFRYHFRDTKTNRNTSKISNISFASFDKRFLNHRILCDSWYNNYFQIIFLQQYVMFIIASP